MSGFFGGGVASDVTAETVALDELSDVAIGANGVADMLVDTAGDGNYSNRTPAQVRTHLSLVPGTDVQKVPEVTSAVTAATTQTQGQGAISIAAGYTSAIYEVGTCANANDVVTLPADAVGLTVLIINNGAQTLQVFPASGDTIDGLAANASTTIAASSRKTFVCYEAGFWSV